MAEVINVKNWIDDNSNCFLPPVCNKLMHNGQLKVFFVGGPNSRKDYHIELGEEFFYMLKGDMVLQVIEKGRRKNVPIREGECFLLPGKIPHSPQRNANTMGLVIERERLVTELDGLRYYVDGTDEPLFERWFHCKDLGTELKPIIDEFFRSEESRTQIATKNSLPGKQPYEEDVETELMEPINVQKWLDQNCDTLKSNGSISLNDKNNNNNNNNNMASRVTFYGQGQHVIRSGNHETFLWQWNSSGTVSLSDTCRPAQQLGQHDSLLVTKDSEVVLVNSSEGQTLAIAMPFLGQC
ncbi:3-hydroxyanthranilate 3,4-dioxygenase [Halotydeus destructor]|nr:3-hydroxyanthranilate 3,4-dioxygenase [Halotydeus destructor]